MEVDERNTPTVVLETAIFALVMVLSLLGNSMVCYAVRRSPSLRTPSNYYIISLALTDIFQALFIMPLSVVFLATGKWPFGSHLCHFVAITKISLAKVSTFTMGLMALNKYYKIAKPAKFPSIFTKKFIIASASVVWVEPFVFFLLVVFAVDFGVRPILGFATCVIDLNPLALPVYIFQTYSPYCVIGFCYWKIYRFVRMHNESVSWQSANVKHINVSKTLFVTVVGFASLWVPAHAMFIMSILTSIPRQLEILVTLLAFTSSCVNPFIYGFMNRAFKIQFKNIFAPRNTNSIAAESAGRH